MKKLLLMILLCSSMAKAQGQVTYVEYYFDSADTTYFKGTGVAVTAGSDVTVNFTADISGLSDGLHVLFVRALGDSGWSLPYSQTFLKEPNTPLASNPDIVRAEYYFDSDPGFGSGVPIPLTPGADRTESFTADLTGLSDGLHNLYLRGMDANGQWSISFSRSFLKEGSATTDPLPNVVAAEYFIDADPGYGQGTPVTVVPGTNTTADFTADLSSVSNGLHVLYMRAMDAGGNWAVTYSKPFLKDATGVSEPAPDLASAEYYFDSDPGFGAGTQIALGGTIDDDATFTAELSTLEPGLHIFYTRSIASDGLWSLPYGRPVLVEAIGSADSPPDIASVDYYLRKSGVNSAVTSFTDFSGGPDITAEICVHLDAADQDSSFEILLVGVDAAGRRSTEYRHAFVVDSAAVIFNKPPHLLANISDVNVSEDFDSLFIADLATVFSDSNIKLCMDSLRFSIEVNGSAFTASLFGPTLMLYGIPDAHGAGSIVVTATDDSGATAVDAFDVDVASVNDLPVASDESVTLLAGPNHTITVLRNDTDVDDDMLSVVELVTGPSHGNASIGTGDSTVVYAAAVNYSGSDQVVYRISDGNGGVDTAVVNITVTPARPLVLSTSVLQNPVLSKYADLYVVADTTLQSAPQVKLFIGSDSSAITMAATATSRIFKGGVEFLTGGVYSIRTLGLSINGLTSVGTRSFNVALAKPGLAAVLASVDGKGRVVLDRATFTKETWLVAQEVIAGGEPAHQFGPLVELQRPAELSLFYDAEAWPDPTKLFVCEWDGASWKQLASRVYPGERRVRAMVSKLGQFKIAYDPTFTGTNVVPETFSLKQNYPNPFNPSTTIAYDLAEDSELKLSVFNLLGQQVKVLHSGSQLAGSYRVEWDGRNDRGERAASGIYFYRMQTKTFVRTQKMILLK